MQHRRTLIPICVVPALLAGLTACTPSTSVLLFNASTDAIVVEACGLRPVEIGPQARKTFAFGRCFDEVDSPSDVSAAITANGIRQTYSLDGLRGSGRYAFDPRGTDGELAAYVRPSGFPLSGARITLRYSKDGLLWMVPRNAKASNDQPLIQPPGFPVRPVSMAQKVHAPRLEKLKGIN